MEQKCYIFKKDYQTQYGAVKANSELRIFRGALYLNGGMMTPAYQIMFMNLMKDEKFMNEYLEEVGIIENKA